MEMTFDTELLGMYISIGDVDSTSVNSDGVRIRMADGGNNNIPLEFAATGTIKGKIWMHVIVWWYYSEMKLCS